MWRLIVVGLGLLTFFKWKEIREGLASVSAGLRQGPRDEAQPPRDDLKEIPGVGPVLEKLLNELGIVSFRQIALLQDDDVERIAAKLKGFKNRIRRDNWIESAKRLHYEKCGEQL